MYQNLAAKLFRLLLAIMLFGASLNARPLHAANFTVFFDNKNQPTIQVTGAGSILRLGDIATGLGGANQTYLVEQQPGIWRLNANLLIDAGVTLNLSPANGVTELQLRSANTSAANLIQAAEATQIFVGDETDAPSAVSAIDYASFVYLKVFNGVLNLDDVKVYSWDAATNSVDATYDNGRAFLLAKYAATMNVRDSEISYLGSGDGESYGLSWRDTNSSAAPEVMQTRVTGEILNSKIHHLYYGVYTYQASNMIVRDNHFYQNVRYGFDPHDYSHHFVVEDNIAYENGAHGFIISRGCHSFIFRRNRSFNNFDTTSNRAHGFMLDPGGASAGVPRSPSHSSLLEDNEAYGNEGYGIRVLMATNNTIRNNNFHHNLSGVSLELGSTGNIFSNNQLNNHTQYGVYVRDSAITNTFSNNTVAENGVHGFYIETGSSQTIVTGNTIRNNLGFGISANGATTFNNRWTQNSLFGNAAGGIRLTSGANQSLAAPVLQSALNNSVTGQATAGATVEVFSDFGAQGQFYEGQTTVAGNGTFAFVKNGAWQANNLTAIVLDGAGNASPFSNALVVNSIPTPTPTITGTVVTSTPTPTLTPTPSATATTVTPSTGTATATFIPTAPPASSATATATPTFFPTAPPSLPATATATNVGMATSTATATSTSVVVEAPTATTTTTPDNRTLVDRAYLPVVRK